MIKTVHQFAGTKQIILPNFSRNPKEHICTKLLQLFFVFRDTKVWLVSLDRMGSLERR